MVNAHAHSKLLKPPGRLNPLISFFKICWITTLATRDEVRATVDALDHVPTARASKQHRSWIQVFIQNSITSNVHSTLEAYDEDHDGDGIVL